MDKDGWSPPKKKVNYRQPAGPNLLITQQHILQLLRTAMQALDMMRSIHETAATEQHDHNVKVAKQMFEQNQHQYDIMQQMARVLEEQKAMREELRNIHPPHVTPPPSPKRKTPKPRSNNPTPTSQDMLRFFDARFSGLSSMLDRLVDADNLDLGEGIPFDLNEPESDDDDK